MGVGVGGGGGGGGGEEGVQTMISKIKLFITKYNWKEMKN